ncbi:hypothetical protein TrLO_g13101 [Triparma laevis f. longispina]|uniref:Uncharacterized protein n=1 Tax=Triparma laevis f. longispina TaxID=1714387 RepID=A0A9W7FR79_9STRA|nr:hypothetical protein TrLO_g13101 [Triparma laevis f. longispina]
MFTNTYFFQFSQLQSAKVWVASILEALASAALPSDLNASLPHVESIAGDSCAGSTRMRLELRRAMHAAGVGLGDDAHAKRSPMEVIEAQMQRQFVTLSDIPKSFLYLVYAILFVASVALVHFIGSEALIRHIYTFVGLSAPVQFYQPFTLNVMLAAWFLKNPPTVCDTKHMRRIVHCRESDQFSHAFHMYLVNVLRKYVILRPSVLIDSIDTL